MRSKTLTACTALFMLVYCGFPVAYGAMPKGYKVARAPLTDTGNRLYGWQGFDHEWLRFVILKDSGRIPHRISRFHNYIDMAQEQFHFAQSTGVDGNYMRPKGYYTVVESPFLYVQEGRVSLRWTDQLTDENYPVATNRLRHQLQIPQDRLAFPDNAVVALQGLKLDLDCDNEKQPVDRPCNSDGMWPYVFRVELGECQKASGSLSCDLWVDIDRAWSPNRGGFQLPPLINEVKPLNERLDYQLELYYSIVSGQENTIRVQPPEEHRTTGHIHQQRPFSGIIAHQVLPETFATSVTLVKGFSFRLNTPDTIEPLWTLLGSDTGHRGRYIARMNFSVRDTDHNPADGTYRYEYTMGLWSPVTVVGSALEMTLTTQTLLLTEQDVATPSRQVSGRLCINSTDQAPAFSQWEFCNLTHWLARWIYGGKERLTDTIAIGD
ncbi:MAG: hypothetical protein R3208_01105 [Ketobacteraceae bacterium]|nr:hypothetical protein [Ketobacteraceae bacterium]